MNGQSREAAFLRDAQERSLCIPALLSGREELALLQGIPALGYPKDNEDEGLGDGVSESSTLVS